MNHLIKQFVAVISKTFWRWIDPFLGRAGKWLDHFNGSVKLKRMTDITVCVFPGDAIGH